MSSLYKTVALARSMVKSILCAVPFFKASKAEVETVVGAIPDNDLINSEIGGFIKFMKTYVVGIKVAYHAMDAGVAYGLTRDFFRRLRVIGGVTRKHDEHIIRVAEEYRDQFRGAVAYEGTVKERKKKILDLASGLINEIEEERAKREEKKMGVDA